jgi:hypothetical protein
MSAMSDQIVLIANLSKTLQEQYGAQCVSVLETHISYVLLTGRHAYKIKKAVKLDFLDFSTLELRRFYCQEELRLNRRYAPQLYLDLVAISGSPEAPVIEGSGPAIEYAVKMREFSQEDLADRVLARGQLCASHIDALATKLATFHRSCKPTAVDSVYGSPETILQRAQEVFIEIRRLLTEPADLADLEWIEQWTAQEFAACSPTFIERKTDGFVRECHGDLHLGNLALIDGEISFFDCIEFSEDLRWIDVMNEVAFLVMDLQSHGRPDYAYRFLNVYLEETGDYAGLGALRFYVVYRAMVRAYVTLLRMSQSNSVDQPGLTNKYRSYVDVAKRWAQPTHAALLLTHGLSGSGKTTVSQDFLQAIGAIRLRSDVERKRMAGMASIASSQSEVGDGLYTGEVTEATYRRLFALMPSIINAGYIVIVDATFLQRGQRRMFSEWAHGHDVPFAILSVAAAPAVLRERITRRAQEKTDASEADLAVLEHQRNTQQPFAPEELASVLAYEPNAPLDEAGSAASWRAWLRRAGISLA